MVFGEAGRAVARKLQTDDQTARDRCGALPTERHCGVADGPVALMQGVTKRFDGTEAVRRLDLAVPGGQVFGLIGPSGCGKTTTIRLLVGALKPTEGTVRVMGADPTRFTTRQRERIGYSAQEFFLYPTLTVIENVRFCAGLYGVGWLKRRKRARTVLRFLEIWEARKRMTRNLSGGMKRRLELACALVHSPSLLFVDEPTAGLDPLLREKIWDYLQTLRSQGTTVFVTTQLIGEVQHCDTVAILDKGHVAAIGTPGDLRRQAIGGETVEVEAEDVTQENVAALRRLPIVLAVRWNEDNTALRLTVEDAASAAPAITQTLQRQGHEVAAVREYVPTFDEVFKKIVSNGAEK